MNESDQTQNMHDVQYELHLNRQSERDKIRSIFYQNFYKFFNYKHFRHGEAMFRIFAWWRSIYSSSLWFFHFVAIFIKHDIGFTCELCPEKENAIWYSGSTKRLQKK